MTTRLLLGLTVVISTMIGNKSADAALLYVTEHLVENSPSGTFSQLELIDTSTSSVTVIGSTGIASHFGDLAASPVAGFAYMVDGRQRDSGNNIISSKLYSLNLSTGATTLIGNAGIPDVFGLAYDPNTATLFATTYSIGTVGLYSLNQMTGAATFIGATADTTTREIDALTYNTATKSLVGYSAGYGNVYTIDETTGALAFQAHLNPSGLSVNHNIGDLAYDAATNKYYSDDISSGSGFGHVYLTDPTTLAFNDIAILDNLGSDVDGLDGILVKSDVPEPSTLVLGIAGLAGLGFVALRKKFRRA
jgi:PEP-CTERM motif